MTPASATIAQTHPAARKASETPINCARPPNAGPLTKQTPRKQMEYSAITRPRMFSRADRIPPA